MPALPQRLWLLRHAITTAPTVLNGAESNVELSDLGFMQAKAMGEWYRGAAPQIVYSSTMTRAIQTAQPIATACGVPHQTWPDLYERRIGPLSGLDFSLTSGPWADTLNSWANGDVDYTTPGAESYRDLTNRLLPAWQNLLEHAAGKRAVVVVHGIVVKVLLLTLLNGYGPTSWNRLGRVQNVSTTELVFGPDGVRANSLLYVPDAVQQLNRSLQACVKRSEG
jgi:2,3-bisphosphoglycerate-dependent phosphoglycerate mutase